jgi:HD-GYP domain-containing protein (c-di-GMP phosphodiesterase class II)
MEDLARATAAVNRALRERDENTSAHSGRTCHLALETGEACGLSADDMVTLKLAAELHDVGKIGIPDRVLLKPGRLDEEEMRVMRTHPRRGHDILASIGGERIAKVATVVLHHHEAVDGSGYPDGLKEEAIPLLSKIVSIADSYDAIAAVRPYHRPRPHAEIMGILYQGQGRKYDAGVLATFATIIEHSAYKASAEVPSLETPPSTGTAS